MSAKARLLLSFAVFVVLFSALTLAFWEFMRDAILLPAYYVIWVIRLTLDSVPQGAFLTLLVIAGVVIGLKTVQNARFRPHVRQVVHATPAGGTRYLHWATLCSLAYHNWFSKGRLAHETRKLVLAVIAYERGISASEAEALVHDGVVVLPDALAEVVTTRAVDEIPLSSRFSGLLARLRQLATRSAPPPDPQVERLLRELIQFLESRMEITHVGNRPEF